MRTQFGGLATAALALAFAAPLSAQEASTPRLELADIRLVGADLRLWGDPWFVDVGAGWQSWVLGRSDTDGAPVEGPPEEWLGSATASVGVSRTWDRLTTEAQFGVLGAWNPAAPEASVFPDRGTLGLGFVRATAVWSGRQTDPRGLVSGLQADLLAEASPAFLSAVATDYTKATASASVLLPLVALDGPTQTFSAVLGLRGAVRWIDGDQVPLLLLETTDLRGFHDAWDSRWRTVTTAELRLRGPSLVGAADLVPVVFGFAEAGWHSGFADAPAAVADRTRWLASVGGGLSFEAFGVGVPTFTLAWPCWGSERDLWWSVTFGQAF